MGFTCQRFRSCMDMLYASTCCERVQRCRYLQAHTYARLLFLQRERGSLKREFGRLFPFYSTSHYTPASKGDVNTQL